jgi:hypothetical protein
MEPLHCQATITTQVGYVVVSIAHETSYVQHRLNSDRRLRRVAGDDAGGIAAARRHVDASASD